MSDRKATPCYKFKGPGGLSLAVWKHAGKFGDYFTFTFSRAYQREGSTEWEYATDLRQRDLLSAKELLSRAFCKLYVEESGNLLKPAPAPEETTSEEATSGEPDPFASKKKEDGDGAY